MCTDDAYVIDDIWSSIGDIGLSAFDDTETGFPILQQNHSLIFLADIFQSDNT